MVIIDHKYIRNNLYRNVNVFYPISPEQNERIMMTDSELVINTQPARDKMIDILNPIWFDLLLLSVEAWGRVDSFRVGLQRPLTSSCEIWRLLVDKNVSQLVHVNSELIPHVKMENRHWLWF